MTTPISRTPRALALLGAGALVLAACGAAPEESGGDEAGGDHSDFKACMVSDSGGFDDRSFNQSGATGLQMAKDEYGVQTQTAESQSDSDYVPNINNLVQSDCDLVFTVGFLFAQTVATEGENNPDTEFAIIDSTAQDADGNTVEVDNVKPISFDTAQAAYLAGYVAAGTSKTGKVATYGGMNIPTVTIFMDGFADGVAKYNEEHDADVELLGWDKENPAAGAFTGDFDDQTKGKALSDTFYDDGADVVMPVAGPVGVGTIASAKERDGAMVIWVDTDGYEANADDPEAQAVMLTSVMKGISNSVNDVTGAAANDEFDNEPYVGTLENEGVGIAPYHELDSEVPQEIKDEVEQLKQDIIDGTIVVESESSPEQE
ncbi:MAG: BMP family ABC transporter substrate-binding protein [Brachybacterium sp.]|nr:BMP family ABC transporter substrate-binding protein [Brachybacterium sp.]